MVNAVTVDAPQAYMITGVRQAADNTDVPQFYSIAAVKFPSESLDSSQNYNIVAVLGNHEVQAAEAYVIFAGKGRTSNPNLRAWTFTMDGHDFYVLRLGDKYSLVYDLTAEEWSEWTSGELPFLRLNTGCAWPGSSALAYTRGSAVIAGDDTWGLLWFLNPKQGYDEQADYLRPGVVSFPRVVQGQVPMTARDVAPCDVLYVDADIGAPSIVGASVTLFTSDDAGYSYKNRGTIVSVEGKFTQELAWRSLGQISAPGRLFRIEDDGAFAALYSLDMNNDAG